MGMASKGSTTLFTITSWDAITKEERMANFWKSRKTLFASISTEKVFYSKAFKAAKNK